MKNLVENAKLALTILGLILGSYGYALKLSASVDLNTRDLRRVEAKTDLVNQMATDIAVIKVQLEEIKQRLPRQAGRTPQGE